MSRPTASTRDGVSFHVVGISDSSNDTSFSSRRLKAQGLGMQVVMIMSAKTAIELGVTIRGVIAFTSTST
jgi:hypothetical protein